MRRTLLAALICAAAAAAVPARAQALHDEIALTRQQIQTDRQAIVAANMELSDADAKTFWPLYRAYRQELEPVGDRLVKLLEDYAAKQKTLTNEEASTMLDEALSIRADEIKVKTKHSKKMRQSLPAKIVARFFQIDDQLDHMLRLQIADEVPLVAGK